MTTPVYPFKSVFRKRKKHWAADSFDLQQAIQSVDGRVIEFAGPSFNGYYFLNRIRFLKPIEITNCKPDGGFFAIHNQNQAKQLISQLLDIEHMNIARGSVGVALLSCLTIMNEATIKNVTNIDAIVELTNQEIDALTAGKQTPPVHSLRALFLFKASKFLEPGGLLIAEQLSLREVQYAKKLGLQLQMFNGVNHDKTDSYYQSLVLQRLK